LASGEGPRASRGSKLRIKVLGKGGGEQRESFDEQHLVFVCYFLLEITNQDLEGGKVNGTRMD
jgi:hypothetical protein